MNEPETNTVPMVGIQAIVGANLGYEFYTVATSEKLTKAYEDRIFFDKADAEYYAKEMRKYGHPVKVFTFIAYRKEG